MAHGRSIATCALATLFLAWRLPGHTQAIKNRSWRFPLRMLRFGKLSSLTKCFKLYRTREPASSLRICFFCGGICSGGYRFTSPGRRPDAATWRRHRQAWYKSGALPCMACHGATLEGNAAIGAPRLAGLPVTTTYAALDRITVGT